MKKTLKNKFVGVLFVAIICSFCVVGASCKKGGGNQSGSSSQSEVTLTLDKAQATVVLGDELYLKADFSGAEDSSLVWTTDNEAVASVDNGKITSNSVGSAIITATYADKSAQCSVTVTTNDMLPTLSFEGIPDEENVTVSFSDKLNFNPYVRFNGKSFTDGSFSVSVSDSSVGTYENGVFTPVAAGETELKINGKWRGIEGPCLNKAITVKVINELSVVVNGGLTSSVSLYTAQTHGGKTYDVSYPFAVTAQENGKDIEYSVAVSSGVDVVAYDEQNKTVNALKYGSAVITVSFKDGNGEAGTLNVPVTVTRPVAEYEEVVEYFSAVDGDIPVDEIFGKPADIKDAYCEGKELTVVNNRILGVNAKRNAATEEVLTVYDDTVGYTVKVVAYTKVIKEESDLSAFNSDFDGFVVLSGDIECSGTNTLCNKGTFKGVFDGNGYLIKKAKFSADASGGGLFGIIGNNAVIRNVGIVDADMSPYNSAILAGCSKTQYNTGALIENIYVKVAKAGSRPGVLMWQRCPWDVINNVLIDSSCFSTSGFGTAYGTMFASDNYAVADSGRNWAKNVANITNVYVVAKDGVPLSDNVAYSKTYPAKIYAFNDGKTDDATKNEYVYTGVKRYADMYALAGAINKIGDDENYWTITETTVEWKGKLPEFDTVDYDKTVEFSALDGDLPVADIFGNENAVITEAYQGGTSLHVVNNKVLGVATRNDGVTETSIVVCGATGKYKVKLNAYTKIIDEESDFSVFDVSGGTVNGCYVLGGDVVCKGEIEWKNVSADKNSKYFNGIFDGRGHKIIGIRVGERGLFGALGNEAVIKNIAFTDSILSDAEEWKYTPFLAYNSAAGDKSSSKIENVYIQFKNFREAKGGNRGAGLLFDYNANITIKDVIVEIKTTNFNPTPQFGYGALFAQDKVHGAANNLINVKVVSAVMPVAMITDVDLNTGVAKNNWATYAGNDKESAGKLVKDQYYYYETVTRYDSMAALAAATNKVGNWKVTADGAVWEENA